MRCDYHKKITNLDSLGTSTKWRVWAGPGRPGEGGRERQTLSQASGIKGGGGAGSQEHRDWKVWGEWSLEHRLEGEDRGSGVGGLKWQTAASEPNTQPSGNFHPQGAALGEIPLAAVTKEQREASLEAVVIRVHFSLFLFLLFFFFLRCLNCNYFILTILRVRNSSRAQLGDPSILYGIN